MGRHVTCLRVSKEEQQVINSSAKVLKLKPSTFVRQAALTHAAELQTQVAAR